MKLWILSFIIALVIVGIFYLILAFPAISVPILIIVGIIFFICFTTLAVHSVLDS
jgi:xanthosine utilization system XapX-like protein